MRGFFNDDRIRLHFYLGNDVPRRIRDDPSLSGTLKLMDSLFDQDKINEEDFTLLINAFDQIHCVDAAKLLREHLKQNRSNGRSKSTETLSLIMPPLLNQLFDDQEEDKLMTEHLSINSQIICGHRNVMINTNHTNINQHPVIVDEGKQVSNSSTVYRKWLLLLSLLFFVGCGILLVIIVVNTIQNKELNAKHSQSIGLIKELNYQVKELQEERSTVFKARDRWKQNGLTVAGGYGSGNRLDQLKRPYSIYINHDDGSLFIADSGNDRIVRWKKDATKGEVVAGGNGRGNQLNQLNDPLSVTVDRERDNLIICDSGNRRILRWPLRSNTEKPSVLSNSIDCYGLAFDKVGRLYTSDSEKHEVRRWNQYFFGNRTLVAGGHGEGNDLDQLNTPTNIFIDDEYSVYVSDWFNHRVMKWTVGSNTGMIVAGGEVQGKNLTQALAPQGIFVDDAKTLYVVDYNNHQIMRWFKEAKERDIIVGGNGAGNRTNQLNSPEDLTFDHYGNLYVVDISETSASSFSLE